MKTSFSLYVEVEDVQKLDIIAKDKNISRNQLIIDMIKEMVK